MPIMSWRYLLAKVMGAVAQKSAAPDTATVPCGSSCLDGHGQSTNNFRMNISATKRCFRYKYGPNLSFK